jgi:two-component system response regulator NreC
MRVILISGEPAFRFGFRAVVELSGDLDLVADAEDARAGLHAIDGQTPDVVVMDVALRGMEGAAATREIKRRAPEARVLLVAAQPREREVLEGFAAGADGLVLKTEPIESLIYAVRSVGHGNRYLSSGVRGLSGPAARAIEQSQKTGVAADVLDALSPREREVMDLVIRGWRNREMARELCVSMKTIDTHRTRINRKLSCRSSGDLIRFAANNGLLPHDAAEEQESQRTLVLLMDDSPGLRTALLRNHLGPGCEPQRESTLTGALAASRNTDSPALFVIDASEGHGVRVVASLQGADAPDRLLQVWEQDEEPIGRSPLRAECAGANPKEHFDVYPAATLSK